MVVNIANQLVKNGKGDELEPRRPRHRDRGHPEATGVVVSKVLPGTAAAKAGLVAGDRITALNGAETPTSTDLSTALASLKPGQTVKVVVVHQSGVKATLSLTLGQYPGGTS